MREMAREMEKAGIIDEMMQDSMEEMEGDEDEVRPRAAAVQSVGRRRASHSVSPLGPCGAGAGRSSPTARWRRS